MIYKTFRYRLRQAFSLLETVVVLGIVALLAMTVLPNLDFQQGVSKDAAAQTNIEAALDSQTRLRDTAGRFMDLSSDFSATPESDQDLLSKSNPEVTFLAPNLEAKAAESVSVALDGPDAVIVAASGGSETCWITRRDYAAAEGIPTAFYSYVNLEKVAGSNCTAEYALTYFSVSTLQGIETTANAPGASWQRPYEIR